MGYYTQFLLTAAKHNGKLDEKLINRDLQKIAFEGLFLGEYTDTIKWYEYIEDVTALSKLHPNVLFQLDGTGEESGDVWRAYACNGEWKEQAAVFHYPNLDPNLMFTFATMDRTITDEEYKNALDEIERAELMATKAKDLVDRYKAQ